MRDFSSKCGLILLGIIVLSLSAFSGCGGEDGGGNPAGPDNEAPANVANFSAVPGNGTVSLSWANPAEGDLGGTDVRRSTVAAPADETEGDSVFDGYGESFTDQSVANDTTYYYTAFAYDQAGNYATGVSDDATPHVPVVVDFADANLEQAIRSELGIPSGDLTDLDLLPLTELSVPSSGIVDLQGIENCVNLEELNLSNNPLSDGGHLSALAQLPELWKLQISYSDLTSLDPIGDVTTLTYLRISNESVSDLTALSSLTELNDLFFAQMPVTDLSPLSDLTGLEYLGFAYCDVEDLGPLAGLTGLTRLQAQNAPYSDVTPLAGLVQLQDLNITHTYVSDLAALPGLPALESVDAIHTPLLGDAVHTQIPALEAQGVSVTYTLSIPLEMVGSWSIYSVEVNGTPTDPADFFEWEPGTVSSLLEAASDATYHTEDQDAGGQALYYEDGTLDVVGDVLEVVVDAENGVEVPSHTVFEGTWSITGDEMVLTGVDGLDTLVLTWVR